MNENQCILVAFCVLLATAENHSSRWEEDQFLIVAPRLFVNYISHELLEPAERGPELEELEDCWEEVNWGLN